MTTVSFSDHYYRILDATVLSARKLIRNQIVDSASPNFGGFIDYSDGMAHPGTGPGSLLSLIPVFIHPKSKLFGDEKLKKCIEMVFDFCDRVQREDGTFDLLTTNFHSSPDNGFIMHNLARTWKVLKSYSSAGLDCADITERLRRLIERTAAGMVGGGFHTPNHRWVIAAGLALAYNITEKAELKEVADAYLAEGIDCDEDGEYTERSSGIYNAVNDNALIILADEMEKPELLEHVVRNLEMMFSYFEPDGSVFTWNSTRQDQGTGSARFFATPYYHIYLLMLLRKSDRRYAWMAESIFNQAGYGKPPSALWLYMSEPALQSLHAPSEPPARLFDNHYEDSGIARIGKNDLSITLMENSSSFLFLAAKELNVRMKICASFFGKAQVVPRNLRRSGDGFKLDFKTTGDYRLPLNPPPKTSIWSEIDHERREHVRILDLGFTLTILPQNDGVEIDVETSGCDRVPVKFEFIFDSGSIVTGKTFILEGAPGGAITATEGAVTVKRGNSTLVIGPAFASHHYTHAMRGGDPPSRSDFTLYFTDFTPLRRRVTIRSTG